MTSDVVEGLSAANQTAFDDVRVAINAGRTIALVGAGVSIRSGYPSWTGLMTIMEGTILQRSPHYKRVLRSVGRISDPLWRAEELRGFLREDGYQQLLKETFQPKPDMEPEAGVTTLVRLPFRHFLTTNYDRTLEEAHFRVRNVPAEIVDWSNPSEVADLLYSLHDGCFERRYVYLHGRYNDPARIVLTDRDYTRRYLAANAISAKLLSLFATQRIVFIGFSLTDPALMHLLRQLKSVLGTGAARHFAILGISPTEGADETVERARLASLYGVEPVFYPNMEDHRYLGDVIHALADCRQSMPQMPTPVRSQSEIALNSEDPQKGQWGGSNERSGFKLSATVSRPEQKSPTASSKPPADLWLVRLTVSSARPGGASPQGIVRFHLHPTFLNSVREVEAKHGDAVLEVLAWGAFTVGAEVFSPVSAKLELDLAGPQVEAPEVFKQR
jgi:hypothetical protein